jgi:hypothetical protein
VDLIAATAAGRLQTIISICPESGNNPKSRSKRRHSKAFRDYAVERGDSGSLKECAHLFTRSVRRHFRRGAHAYRRILLKR